MKKFVAIILATMTMLALAACGGSSTPAGEGENKGADLSKYPPKLSEWTATQFNQYFTEEGVYTNDKYVYLQDHINYYSGYPIFECGGYMDDEGLYFTGVWTMNKDDSEGSVSEMLDYVRENHTFDESMNSLPVDHLVDNVIFLYSFSQDEAFFNSFEAAYNKLVTELNLTPDF